MTLQGDLEGTPEIEAQIRDHVAERIGKLARPKHFVDRRSAEDEPEDRRGGLQDIAEGRTLGDVTTLRDPAVMAEPAEKIAAAQAQEDSHVAKASTPEPEAQVLELASRPSLARRRRSRNSF